MGFRKGAYATVWEVESVNDRVTKVRISTSRKNKQTDQYEDDFSGFVSFVGTATAAQARTLQKKARIRLGDVDVTNRYDKEQHKSFTNFTAFSFEAADGSSAAAEAPKPAQTEEPDEISEDALPF